MTHLFFQSLQF